MLRCTADYLAGRSSYELRMADHLVAAGRRFVQPLRDDQTDEVVPDFVLGEPKRRRGGLGVKGRELYDLAPEGQTWDLRGPAPDPDAAPVGRHRPPPRRRACTGRESTPQPGRGSREPVADRVEPIAVSGRFEQDAGARSCSPDATDPEGAGVEP